jgi:hypothetical protein
MTVFRNRADGRYPLSDFDLRQINPGVSLPVTIDAVAADAVGADIVTPTAPPAAVIGQKIVEAAPTQVAGAWTQVWTQVALSAPELVVELATHKATKQAALDTLFSANFDLASFIRSGTNAAVTAAQVGTFLATITNNYRTLKASIANAATAAAADAIVVTGGWPANP